MTTSNAVPLTAEKIEKGWRDTFSTDNPYCPCNLKSFTKAVRWAEWALAPTPSAQEEAVRVAVLRDCIAICDDVIGKAVRAGLTQHADLSKRGGAAKL